jgi:hypothetical protein
MNGQPGLAGFFSFLRDIKSVLSWVVKTAALSPLLVLVVKIGPPWPESTTVVAIVTCLVQLVVYGLCYEYFWRRAKRPSATQITWLRILLGLAAVTVLCSGYWYLHSFAAHVIDFPDAKHRVITGIELHSDSQALRDTDPSKYTDTELLTRNEGKPESVWKSESIERVKTGLLVRWAVFWANLALFVATFVGLQSLANWGTRQVDVENQE